MGGHRKKSSVPAKSLECSAPAAQAQAAAPQEAKAKEAVAEHARAELLAAATPGPFYTEDEILRAIASLYDDKLRPYGRIIRKRLTEHLEARRPAGKEATGDDHATEAAPVAAIERDHAKLKAACGGCDRFRVQAEEGGEWSALLRSRPAGFVDIYSKDDPYGAKWPGFWHEAANFFDNLDAGSARLPGGRYASARELLARQPAFLVKRGFSLGEVCHIVQLAIAKRSLLGYLNGTIVAYKYSTSKLKSTCAEQYRPCSSEKPTVAVGSPTLKVATWDEAKQVLQDIMNGALSAEGGPKPVPLSNIKRLCRSRYSLDLSETALGYAKISELMADAKLSSICTVELKESGYVVVPVVNKEPDIDKRPAPVEHDAAYAFSLEGTPSSSPLSQNVTSLESPTNSCSDGSPTSAKVHRKRAPPELTTDFGWEATQESRQRIDASMVRNGFIHKALPPPTPTGPSAGRRSTSLPPDLRKTEDVEALALQASRVRGESSWVGHSRSCPEKREPSMVDLDLAYIPTPGPTPVHGHAAEWPWTAAAGVPLPGEARPSGGPPPLLPSPLGRLFLSVSGEARSSRAAAPPPAPTVPVGLWGDARFAIFSHPPPAPLESPRLDSQVERRSRLNLDSLQVPDAQSAQHSGLPERTPSPRWTTPKGAFAGRLQYGTPSLLNLATLLGSRVNPSSVSAAPFTVQL